MTILHMFDCASIIAIHVLFVCHTHSHADGRSKIQLIVTRSSVCDVPCRAQPAVCQKLQLGGKCGGWVRGGQKLKL